MDIPALWLTLRLATCTTALLLIVGLPLAYWLGRTQWRGRVLFEAAVTLPLVLPPTVLGFYILLATGPNSVIGDAYRRSTGNLLPFSFAGILLASVLFNLPFMLRPLIAAFATIDRRLLEASYCLGVSAAATFWRVTLPLAWPGVLTAIVLTFAHAVGEFGVVLMVGGNIPGVTRTLSIAIYDDVQAMDYRSAGQTSLVLVACAFAALCLTQIFARRYGPL